MNKTNIILAFICLLLISCQNKQIQQKFNEKPNIIYILADDLGCNDLGCYGGLRIKTPNLDHMAEEGIRFINHYSGSSVCAPSRSALMTGLHTGYTPVRDNKECEPYGQYPLPENIPTIASLLKNAGYHTILIGKWGLGVEGTTGDPLKHGFDSYYGYLCQVLAHNHAPEFLMENGEKVYLDNKVQYTDKSHWTKGLGSYPIKINQFSQQLFTQKALNFIETNRNNPFFLYFPVIIPHMNGEAPKGKRYSDIPSFEPYENMDWTESEKGYAAMITYLDKDVGKIFDKLKELDIDKNTIVIFTSDNGPNSPDSFHKESNYPFRGFKGDLYEGGIRVPFIARWPGKIKSGTVTAHVSACWDVMPTLAELIGIVAPDNISGISFLPTLLGLKGQKEHQYLYWELNTVGGKQAIRKDDWKLVCYNVTDSTKKETGLYNLKTDPREEKNLVNQYPEIVDELLKLMNQSRIPSDVFDFQPFTRNK